MTPAPLERRFAQAVVGLLCLEAIVVRASPALAVALGLAVVEFIAPRLSPLALLVRILVGRAGVPPSGASRLVWVPVALFLSLSLALVLAGAPLAGWAIAGVVGAFCLAAAATGRPAAGRS